MNDELSPLSKEAQTLKLGVYEHSKGKRYKVLGVGRHSETLDEMVVYQALYGGGALWVRPIGMFLDEKEIGGKKVPRFKYIG